MSISWRLGVAVALLLGGLPVGAHAAGGGGSGTADGIYVRGFGGYVWQEQSRVNGTNFTDADIEFDESFSFGGALGYRWGKLRIEGFGSWRSHDPDKFDAVQVVTVNPNTGATLTLNNIDSFRGTITGESTTITGMVNGVVDMDFDFWVVPFVGAGIGLARVSLEDVSVTSGGVPFRVADDSDTVLSYQFLAGAGFRVTPELMIETQYRYQTMTDPEFADGVGGKFDMENDAHHLELGLRFNF